MFGRIMGMFKASEATVIVKRAFAALPVPMLPFDPDALATRLVAISYRTKPGLFDGSQGQRPHPLTTAAVSLAGGLSLGDYDYVHTTQKCIFYALGNVLLDASANGPRYGLSSIDMHLLELSEQAYLESRPRFDVSAVVAG